MGAHGRGNADDGRLPGATGPDRDDSAGSGGPSRRRAGELTGLVLAVLRQEDRALTPGEVLRRLTAAGSGPLSYSTVVTILSRLHAQGVAERFRTGRAYAYLPVADAAKLAARRMRRVLDAETDRDAVLTRFVSDLSPADESLLRDLLGTDADLTAAGADAEPDRPDE